MQKFSVPSVIRIRSSLVRLVTRKVHWRCTNTSNRCLKQARGPYSLIVMVSIICFKYQNSMRSLTGFSGSRMIVSSDTIRLQDTSWMVSSIHPYQLVPCLFESSKILYPSFSKFLSRYCACPVIFLISCSHFVTV